MKEVWGRVYPEKLPVILKLPLILWSWGADKEGKEAPISSIEPFTRLRDGIDSSATFPRDIDPAMEKRFGRSMVIFALFFVITRLPV
jgi:hypothetical protein